MDRPNGLFRRISFDLLVAESFLNRLIIVADCGWTLYNQGIIQESELGGVGNNWGGCGGGCCERSEQKKFFHTPPRGVFFAYEHPPGVFCSVV